MKNRNQKLWIAFLSIIDAGLGHIYSGNVKLGIIIYLLFQLLIVLFYFTSLATFTALVISLLFLILLRIGIAIHAALNAKMFENKSHIYRRGSFVIGFIILSIIFNYTLHWSLEPLKPYKTRRIAGASMHPTLQKGDFLVVDNDYYSDTEPARGDVVIYNPPHDTLNSFVGRIIGIEGDIIKCINGVLHRNNNAVDENYLVEDNNVSFDELTVPKERFFILGDNRADSFDGRHYGYVKRNAIYGKLLYLYFSTDLSRIGTTFERN